LVWSCYCVLDEAGKVILEQKLPTTSEAMKQTFARIARSLIALETGTHSPWVSRLLRELGHEVLVAHAQKVQLISKSNRKDDRHDARTLARLIHGECVPVSSAIRLRGILLNACSIPFAVVGRCLPGASSLISTGGPLKQGVDMAKHCRYNVTTVNMCGSLRFEEPVISQREQFATKLSP
jgi:hypothetical protein